jgi:CRP-like cAMP-binding protein
MAQAVDWPALERASPLLAALPEAARRSARVMDLPRAARLFNSGDRPMAMYYVMSGEVHLARQSLAGSELVLQRTHRGFLAEASLDQAAYHCDAVAVVPSEVLVLAREVFHLALSDECFRSAWVAHLARELRRARAQCERLSLRTAGERIVHYIETEGDSGSITLGRSKKEWAAELGLTHEALYRALGRMQRSGQITVNGSALSRTGHAGHSQPASKTRSAPGPRGRRRE